MEYRVAEENDAEPFLNFFKAIVFETDNLAATPEEAGKMTVEDEKTFIKNANGSFSVIAIENGIIYGSCDIRIPERARLRHRAELGIAVRKECWGTGIAERLLKAALEGAEEKNVKKVELTVREDNERAKSFYKRHGFTFVAKDRMLFLIDGEFIDGERYEIIL